MLQGITTKYLGPSHTRGSRIKATEGGGFSKTYPLDYALSTEGNHTQAARALAEHLGWAGLYVGGGANSTGFHYVNIASPFSLVSQAYQEAAHTGAGVDWFLVVPIK